MISTKNNILHKSIQLSQTITITEWNFPYQVVKLNKYKIKKFYLIVPGYRLLKGNAEEDYKMKVELYQNKQKMTIRYFIKIRKTSLINQKRKKELSVDLN